MRKAHEQLVGLICKYLAKTAKTPPAAAPSLIVPAAATKPPVAHPTLPDDLEEAGPDPVLDAETAGQ